MKSGEQAFFCEYITVAYTACLNSNPDLSWSRLRDVPLDDFEVSPRSGYLYRLQLSHPRLPSLVLFEDVRITSPHDAERTASNVF
jgi:hypothetical protein